MDLQEVKRWYREDQLSFIQFPLMITPSKIIVWYQNGEFDIGNVHVILSHMVISIITVQSRYIL